jgi:hypothetical protein
VILLSKRLECLSGFIFDKIFGVLGQGTADKMVESMLMKLKRLSEGQADKLYKSEGKTLGLKIKRVLRIRKEVPLWQIVMT